MIESCTEGFLVWNLDEAGSKTNEKYAITEYSLVKKIKNLLGTTEKKLKKLKPQLKIDTMVAVSKKKEIIKSTPKSFINDNSSSTFLRYNNNLPSGSEIAKGLDPAIKRTGVLPSFIFTELVSFEVSVQPIKAGKSIYWLHPDGKKIKISRSNYLSVFVYAKIEDLVYLYGHQSEQQSILYAYGNQTYENKAVVLRGFLKDVPLSALVGDHHNNGVVPVPMKKEEPIGQEDGSCDDVSFESCANNAPEQCKYCINQSRYQNKNKVAAQKI